MTIATVNRTTRASELPWSEGESERFKVKITLQTCNQTMCWAPSSAIGNLGCEVDRARGREPKFDAVGLAIENEL